MKPLIQAFTKNLSPCSGCGNGKIVKYQLTVEVETENPNDDLFSVAQTDRSKWKVIGARPIHEATTEQGMITGSQFQRTTTQPTNG